MCECEDGLVHQIQEDFKSTLQGQNSLETWALWLEGVVNRVLSPHEGGPHFAKAARQFLLKWSFYRYANVALYFQRDKLCIQSTK